MSGEIDKLFPARTPVRAKPDGLTPVALRAKRPLIAPSHPSSSRLAVLRNHFGTERFALPRPTFLRQKRIRNFRGLEVRSFLLTSAVLYGTSQTCRGCRGNWKFRSLEAWKFGTTPHPSPRRGAPFSVAVEGLALRACTLRSLFSGAASPPLGSQRALARPKSATNLRNLRFPLRRVLCVPLCIPPWSSVS